MRSRIAAFLLACSSAFVHANWQEVVPDARVSGEGDLRFLGLRIYSAKLWTPGGKWVEGVPFALELTYHRSISRERFVSTSLDEIRRIQGNAVSETQLESWAAEMRRGFVDVSPGERIVGVFLPGQGCRFYAGNQLQHEVRDPVFASAFFAIWLDPRTRDQGLRQKLMGVQ
jgi:hypothetical protein